jgi:hypothetical protein
VHAVEDAVFLLVLTFTLVVVPILMAILAWIVGTRLLHRRNRVSPKVRSDAPVSWMGAPSAGARLHRRLRTAVQVARRSADAAPAATHLGDLVSDLEREAVILDTHVVIASGMRGPEGRARMRALAGQVRRVEQLASQISLLAAQAQAPLVAGGHGSALDELARQLDMLEEARHEVAEVERGAGVRRVSPFADPTRSVPAPDLRKQPEGYAQPGV